MKAINLSAFERVERGIKFEAFEATNNQFREFVTRVDIAPKFSVADNVALDFAGVKKINLTPLMENGDICYRARLPQMILQFMPLNDGPYICNFELCLFAENIVSENVSWQLSVPKNFTIEVGRKRYEAFLRGPERFTGETSPEVISINKTLVDTEGMYFDGFCYDMEAFLKIGNQQSLIEAANTISAAKHCRAFEFDEDEFKKFGPFLADANNIKGDYHADGISDFDRIVHNLDPREYLGGVGHPQSRTTGFQDGFGPWGGFEIAKQPLMFWTKFYQAVQDICRIGNYFESDLSRVKASNHPNWVAWGERTHYSHVVSPDRLGRMHQGDGFSWSGYDREHDQNALQAYLAKFSPSLRSYQEKRKQAYLAGQTIPSMKPGWSTNSAEGGGRGFGRPLLGMVVTGDRELLERAEKRIEEVLIPYYNQTNQGHSEFKVLRVINNDPRVFNPGAGWIPWEDSLCLVGLAAYLVAAYSKKVESEIISTLVEIIKEVGTSLILHGYNKAGTEAINHYRLTPERTVWTEEEEGDRTKVKLATGTDYRHWCLAGISAAYPFIEDEAIKERARLIVKNIEQLGNTKSFDLWARGVGVIE